MMNSSTDTDPSGDQGLQNRLALLDSRQLSLESAHSATANSSRGPSARKAGNYVAALASGSARVGNDALGALGMFISFPVRSVLLARSGEVQQTRPPPACLQRQRAIGGGANHRWTQLRSRSSEISRGSVFRPKLLSESQPAANASAPATHSVHHPRR